MYKHVRLLFNLGAYMPMQYKLLTQSCKCQPSVSLRRPALSVHTSRPSTFIHVTYDLVIRIADPAVNSKLCIRMHQLKHSFRH